VCVNKSFDDTCGMSYRSQHGGHELVRLLGLHEAAHLEHANGQAGYHGHATEALKGSQVRLVYVGEVRVGHDDVGQRLDVAQTVGKPVGIQHGAGSLHILSIYLVGSSRRQ
jgi:hypothetical protein